MQFLVSLHAYFGGSLNLSKKTMAEFYHYLSMQALSISSNQAMIKFDAIVELVKSIAQLLKDNVEVAIVRTRENDRFFAGVLAREEQEQPDTSEIDRTAAEKNIESLILYRQRYQTKMK